jgi:predicted nucleotidyltransferase
MHVRHPATAVVPSLDGDVLVTLARATEPLSGRQVARLADRGSQTAVATVLDRLVGQGLVHRERAGRAHLHALNREHLAAPIVERLAGLRAELLRRLRAHFATWEIGPVHASLFGSTARGDGGLDSDVDLLIVRPDAVDSEDETWWSQVEALDDKILAWTGNHPGSIVISETRFVSFRTDPPGIVTDLRRDGIDLAGTTLEEAFAGASSVDMTPRPTGRLRQCNRRDAVARLEDAETQLTYARLATPSSGAAERKAATSCAVIAGIAAADAACCVKLGERSRGQDHREAVALLRRVPDGGVAASGHLRRLLTLKDQSQYGVEEIGGRDLLGAQRQAAALVAFARRALGD